MEIFQVLLLGVLPVFVVAGALSDITSMTIPNWISLVLLAVFPVAAVAVGLSPGQIGLHFAFGLGVLVLGMALFAMNILGGGDAKLVAAASLWLGLGAGPIFILATAVAGGLFSLALLMARGVAAPIAAMGPGWLGRLLQPKGDIPYGVAIAAGAVLAYPQSALIGAFTGG